MKHQVSSSNSRSLCDLLFTELLNKIPELNRNEAESSCSLSRRGMACFAFVYHQKTGAKVTVWCLGATADLQNAATGSSLSVIERGNRPNNGGWQDRFSCRFTISSPSQIADAAEILNSVSYQKTINAKNPRQKEVREPSLLPEEVPHDVQYTEGTVTQIVVNSYERNLKARFRCIKFYGAHCRICNFNFKDTYGEAGLEYIHVHHIKPLSEIKQGYIVNPIKDIIPICPNCHAIVHRKTPPYTVEEVQAMIQNAKSKLL